MVYSKPIDKALKIQFNEGSDNFPSPRYGCFSRTSSAVFLETKIQKFKKVLNNFVAKQEFARLFNFKTLKAQRQVLILKSRCAEKYFLTYVIQHANFQLYRTYPPGVIWKNRQMMTNI